MVRWSGVPATGWLGANDDSLLFSVESGKLIDGAATLIKELY